MSAYFENRNSKIYISYNKKSYNYDSHFHSKTEIAYCFSGFQDVKVGNTVYTLQKGDAVIIFPNVVHEYIKNETKPDLETKSISIICETDYLRGGFPDLLYKNPRIPFIKSDLVPDNSALAFEKMIETKDESELVGWTFIAISGLIKNLDLIPLKMSNGLNLAPSLITYINVNFQKPLTIKYLGKEFGYSSSYIAHVFYDQLKIPFRTYLGAVRSEYAANMICTTTKSLTEIAHDCGYDSLNTFCRCFKKHFSKTPSQYRFDFRANNELK